MQRRMGAVWVSVLAISPLLLPSVSFGQQPMSSFPRILNGSPTEQFAAVGIVGTSAVPSGFCTGTLIGPNHVLTAGHCAQLVEGPTDGRFEIAGSVFTTSAVFIHPDFNPITFDNDIAVFELSQVVETVLPSPIFRGIPLVGDEITIVGFGAGGDGESGEDGSFGTKMVGTTTIDAVTDTLIIWEFDSNDESNTAPGDSGGPGYLFVDGEYQLACVVSSGTRADAGLGDIAMNTRVDAFASWIDAILVGELDPGGGEPDVEDGDDEDEDDDKPTCLAAANGGWFSPDRGEAYRGGGHRFDVRRPGRQPGSNRRPPLRKIIVGSKTFSLRGDSRSERTYWSQNNLVRHRSPN